MRTMHTKTQTSTRLCLINQALKFLGFVIPANTLWGTSAGIQYSRWTPALVPQRVFAGATIFKVRVNNLTSTSGLLAPSYDLCKRTNRSDTPTRHLGKPTRHWLVCTDDVFAPIQRLFMPTEHRLIPTGQPVARLSYW